MQWRTRNPSMHAGA